ncbi:MAG TPA: hypothetical protein VM821_03140 [Abditibacteriaceae bacterium]|nr:hypothetical protein [Abditibacteriaceae bacterium]
MPLPKSIEHSQSSTRFFDHKNNNEYSIEYSLLPQCDAEVYKAVCRANAVNPR